LRFGDFCRPCVRDTTFHRSLNAPPPTIFLESPGTDKFCSAVTEAPPSHRIDISPSTISGLVQTELICEAGVLVPRHGIQKNDAPELVFVAVFPGRIGEMFVQKLT